MIKGAGMILQSRMQISLRGVAGVARLAEQREVGQTQLGDQGLIGQQARLICYGQLPGMGKNCDHPQAHGHEQNKGQR